MGVGYTYGDVGSMSCPEYPSAVNGIVWSNDSSNVRTDENPCITCEREECAGRSDSVSGVARVTS